MANNLTIDLNDYRTSPESRVFSGRPRGEWCRRHLRLDEHDKTGDTITIIVPRDTYSVNMSFFLGLLGESVRSLGIDAFRMKYRFDAAEHLLKAFPSYEREALKEDIAIPEKKTA
jgi:hypothetical protein